MKISRLTETMTELDDELLSGAMVKEKVAKRCRVKRAVVIVMILFFAIILFFSFYGERFYYLTKPTVTVYRAQNMWINENDGMRLVIPKESVYDSEYVYVVNQMSGFSLTINTVSRKEVDISDAETDNYVIVNKGLNLGDMIVVKSSEELNDGDRINCVESLDNSYNKH